MTETTVTVFTLETKEYGTEPGAYTTKGAAEREMFRLKRLAAYRNAHFETVPRVVKDGK